MLLSTQSVSRPKRNSIYSFLRHLGPLGCITTAIFSENPSCSKTTMTKNWRICRPECWEINFFTLNIGMCDWLDAWTYTYEGEFVSSLFTSVRFTLEPGQAASTGSRHWWTCAWCHQSPDWPAGHPHSGWFSGKKVSKIIIMMMSF